MTARICSADGCNKPICARGLCINHYTEQIRRKKGIRAQSDVRRFSDAENLRIRQEYEGGKTLSCLAEEYHAKVETIARCVRRAGGTLRKPGRIPSRTVTKFDPQKLRAAREKAGLTQEGLAAKIGCPKPDMIRQWEKGERTPNATYLLRILIACNVRPAALLGPVGRH